MHTKVIFIRPAAHADATATGGNSEPQGPSWAYVGSANLSESAWYVHAPISFIAESTVLSLGEAGFSPRILCLAYERAHLGTLDGFTDIYYFGNTRGRLVKDSKSGKPKMSCRNWECGVVLPAGTRATAAITRTGVSSGTKAPHATLNATSSTDGPTKLDDNSESGDAMGMFANLVPIPMKMPGRPYGPNEEPWFYTGAR